MRAHRSKFPRRLIVVEVAIGTRPLEWRTFTQPHHAAGWLSRHAVNFPTEGQWCRVEIFTPGSGGHDITEQVVDAAEAGLQTVHTTRTEFERAVTGHIKEAIKANCY